MPGLKLVWRGRKQAVASSVLRRYYREYVGPLEPSQHVHHKCRNPWCIEPTHLAAVSAKAHNRLLHGKQVPVSFDGDYS